MLFPSPKMVPSEAELETLLAEPYPETVDVLRRLEGDVMILGAGGKMGPSLARLAANACRLAGGAKRVIAVSRFSDKSIREKLEAQRVATIACDLLDGAAVDRLPRITNVIFMAGRKFGERGSESLTWMNNVVVPANVARIYRDSRIVVFSTGCVYPLVGAETGGSRETDAPEPIGEYANSCLGRERVFEFCSERFGTRVVLFRLNYAIDLRYGVLHDIAANVYNRRPVDLTVNAVNFIWQGDANNRALLSLARAQSPPAIVNVTGPETFEVRSLAEQFARRFGVEPQFTGTPGGRAYLSNPSRSIEWFGPPRVPGDLLIDWEAEWVKSGGKSLGKPTHFQVVDGQFLG